MITLPQFTDKAYFIHHLKVLSLLYAMNMSGFVYLQALPNYDDLKRSLYG